MTGFAGSGRDGRVAAVMAIIRAALDPDQGALASRFEVLPGEPAQRLPIMSGTVIREPRAG